MCVYIYIYTYVSLSQQRANAPVASFAWCGQRQLPHPSQRQIQKRREVDFKRLSSVQRSRFEEAMRKEWTNANQPHITFTMSIKVSLIKQIITILMILIFIGWDFGSHQLRLDAKYSTLHYTILFYTILYYSMILYCAGGTSAHRDRDTREISNGPRCRSARGGRGVHIYIYI